MDEGGTEKKNNKTSAMDVFTVPWMNSHGLSSVNLYGGHDASHELEEDEEVLVHSETLDLRLVLFA